MESMEGGGVRSSVMLRGTGARLSNLCLMIFIVSTRDLMNILFKVIKEEEGDI